MRKLLKKSVLTASLISAAFCTHAATHHYLPGERAQLPPELNQTYMGFGAGYTDIPYSNSDLINGIRATSFKNPSFGLNVFIGHFFNPYLAAQVSLMRPVKWAYANGIQTPTDKHSIWISLFGVALRPTLPVSERMSLYGLAGVGIVSRHGFSINNTVANPSEDMMSFLTGGGLTYALTPHWHLDLGVEDALARPEKQQPNVFYSFAGFYYIFQTLHLPHYYSTHYIFHKNLIQVGGLNTDVFNPNINRFFTVGYLPIFWTGDVKAKNGAWFMYERNIFHTHKIFSFDLGTSVSTYHSLVNNTSFQAFSVFPAVRFWFLRSPQADLYFTYSVAGPTYLTQSHIDGIYLGGRFSFQDMLGVGAFLGQAKELNLAMTLGHYSNGNLLPNNPGVEVPLVVSVGYAFS